MTLFQDLALPVARWTITPTANKAVPNNDIFGAAIYELTIPIAAASTKSAGNTG
jgi:hypothetical protein